MILQSDYTPPPWVSQSMAHLVAFIVGYGSSMSLLPDNSPWFNWHAVMAGLLMAGAYTGGLVQAAPWHPPQIKSP